MMRLFICFTFLFPSIVFAQINKQGYNGSIWGQSKESLTIIKSVDTKADFMYCEVNNKDSLFLGKYKYTYCNYRFYKNQLSEIHFDLNPNDLGNIVSYLTKTYNKPTILEKKQSTSSTHEISIGYKWNIGDSDILIINDGTKNPILCIVKSTKITNTYPQDILNIEKLIFE